MFKYSKLSKKFMIETRAQNSRLGYLLLILKYISEWS